MNYKIIYDNIIGNAKIRGLKKTNLNYYTEKHHIVPHCLNGTDESSNLVLLTAREHFVCHQLLYKMYKNTEFNAPLLLAISKMCSSTNNHIRNNKLYSWYRIKLSNHMKVNNPMFNDEIRSRTTKTRMKNISLGLIKPIQHTDTAKSEFSKRMKLNNPMKNDETVNKVKESLKLHYDKIGRNATYGPKMPTWFRMKIRNPMSQSDLHNKSAETQKRKNSQKRKHAIKINFDENQIQNIIHKFKSELYSVRDISIQLNKNYKLINYIIIEYDVKRDESDYNEAAKKRLIERMKTNNPNKKCSDPSCGTSMCG